MAETHHFEKPRLVFIANSMYTRMLAGGELHTIKLAEFAASKGYPVLFFAGHAFAEEVQARGIPSSLILTDQEVIKACNFSSLTGQFRLFFDYFRRLKGTFSRLSEIKAEDIVYANSDLWWDTLPMMACKSVKKMMVLHMDAPSLTQVLLRSRPDVDPARLASLHHSVSQSFSLRAFRRCRRKRLLYVHPRMRQSLLRRGYKAEELEPISFGVDVEEADKNFVEEKLYDVVWIGRVHRQKGIEDLLAALSYLAGRISNFRAVLIGRLQEKLQPRIDQLGLSRNVTFSGVVSEQEKFRLFHASRVFLMPSRFEGSPRVVAEALICNVPVVAYEVETYRAVFGDFLRYVPCFDVQAFCFEAEQQARNMRAGKNYLASRDLAEFRRMHSWEATGNSFCAAVGYLQSP